MEFLSKEKNDMYRSNYECSIKNMICNTNYNYRASNTSNVDNQYSCVKCNYTIHPDINIYYETPYNTGKCVIKLERKQIPFDMHKNPRLFSNFTGSATVDDVIKK